MANHRADRSVRRAPGSAEAEATPTARSSSAGRRKADKPSRAALLPRRTLATAGQNVTASASRVPPGRRTPFLPSAPSLVGAAALAVAATGAVSLTHDGADVATAADLQHSFAAHASALTGESTVASTDTSSSRERAVSRDSRRDALRDAADAELLEAAEAQMEERNAALAQLAASAERYAGEIAANQWVLPLSGYRLTARFGYSSGLWSSTHTGLDFAAPSGTPVVSVANGVVTETGYAGAYGNRVIVTLDDGTEIWYCHLSSYAVSSGQAVRGGQPVGTVGSTGNSTGPHLHLEVRPGAGDAVDPYAALLAHGLQP